MRNEIAKAITLTIFFGSVYIFTTFQANVTGRILIYLQTDMLIAIYSFLLAYIMMGAFKYTKPIKPFALSVALYLILKVVSYSISKFSRFAIVYPFVYSMDMYFLLFFISFAISKIELPEMRYSKYLQPVISALGLILMGLFGYYIILNLPTDPQKTQNVALGFIVFLLILAVTTLANLSEKPYAKWLRNSRAFLLGFLILVTAYYIGIRPLILDRPGLLNFMEWAFVGIFLLKFTGDLRKSTTVEEIEAVEVHRQRLSYKRDEIIVQIDQARKLFLEEGKKSPLIAVLSRVLFDAGWSEDRVAVLISPLISYRDEGIPSMSFGWEKERILNKNRKNRMKILEKIEEKLRKEGVEIGS